jgi:hypothetical protein
MSPPVSLMVLIERIENLKLTLDEKHTQNRKDIHLLRNDVQSLTNQIWLIKLKLAAYAAGGSVLGGSVATGIIKLIEHFAK